MFMILGVLESVFSYTKFTDRVIHYMYAVTTLLLMMIDCIKILYSTYICMLI